MILLFFTFLPSPAPSHASLCMITIFSCSQDLYVPAESNLSLSVFKTANFFLLAQLCTRFTNLLFTNALLGKSAKLVAVFI